MQFRDDRRRLATPTYGRPTDCLIDLAHFLDASKLQSNKNFVSKKKIPCNKNILCEL